MWDGFIERLSDQFCSIVIDLPGFGESSALPDEVSIEYFAWEVKRLLDRLGFDRFSLVGHSLGGYVSLAMIHEWPDQVMSLSMVNSTAFADSDTMKETRLKTIRFVEKYGGERFVRSAFQLLFSESSHQKMPDDIQNFIDEAALTREDTIIKTQMAIRNRRDQTDLLRKADFPVQYVIGKEDQTVPLEASLAQCHLAKDNWSLILGDVGHMCFMEAQAQAFSAIQAFLEYCFEQKTN